MWEQTVVFFVWVGCAALITVFLVLFVTLLGLAVGENPREWWRGFWSLGPHVPMPPQAVYLSTGPAAFQLALKLTAPPMAPSALKSGRIVPYQ